ncbi:MAG TPA: undecaprenyl-phosphate galactose phosphotransferase WbaP [Methylomusa anaerophila]|uniref:UDP-glucose:undecaprenyl-phosphate glucose-1-phosphate transferase n=2 Tax=Methylomusa anaerophila TaxID=1930071 RepID=A0A348AKL9_9FIRM|nr:undecaprenyl-phosphate galactose phosphotransferase WbaP [Methylomusa anaerophila]BBB91617.1 UDP-glucose:undecaprenyl-phosphate glucose-1-phosphate transferase [Methylomusa anaerophila]HML89445.1 undecaprenyl-phosphate galactose phosphotransferase WbaP [Methylomusa anaerophila]
MFEAKPQTLSLDSGIFGSAKLTDKLRRLLVPTIFVCTDYAAVILAIWTAYMLRVNLLPGFLPLLPFTDIPNLYTYVAIPLTVLFFMHFDNMYTRRLPLWQQTEKIFKITVYSFVFILMIMYMTEIVKHLSRPFMIMLGVFTFGYLACCRYLVKKALISLDLWQIPVVLVGAGKTAELLMQAFCRDSGLGYKVVGLIEDNRENIGPAFHGIPVIGSFADAEEAVKQVPVKNVLIAAPGLRREGLVDIVYRLQPYVRNITFVPDLFGIPVGSMELDTLLNEKIVLLNVRNNLAQSYNRMLKRIFDIVLATFGGIAIAPLLLSISVIIYLDSPGPVIFSHKRVGPNGKMFGCYKFRTMEINAQEVLQQYLSANPDAKEEWEKDFKLKNDPRITRIGKFLRQTSLDELPQLLNVLKGEMSLVGPRPIVQEEISKYGDYILDYYLVRPGMTGFWQVHGRNDVEYAERVQMDSWYVRNWSMWLDVVLLLKTLKTIYNKNGAY